MTRAMALCLLVFALEPASACLSAKLDSVHFNAGHLDFGIVPRRGIVWYEHTDRPAGPNGFPPWRKGNAR